MRVLVTGGYGFIGAQVVARLSAEGHEVVGLGRRIAEAKRRRPDLKWIQLDAAEAVTAADWAPHLAGIEAVVNCLGVLQDNPHDSTYRVHVAGVGALFDACEDLGIRRIVHVSALGVGDEADTEFARTKAEADAELVGRALDWVVLRPSLVIGRGAYGGTALIRALAAFPLVTPVVGGLGPIQTVHVGEVAATVAFFLRPEAPSKLVLELTSSTRHSLAGVVQAYRRWLGLAPVPVVAVPRRLAALACRLGDAASWLGWRPPLRTTALRQLAHGVAGDPREWTRVTRLWAPELDAALATDPATSQERWFGRLYLLKPIVLVTLALFWIATGAVALGPGWRAGVGLMTAAGLGAAAPFVTWAGALADIAVGTGMLLRRTAKAALVASLGLALAYLIAATALAPQLWSDPLGPLAKIVPAMLSSLVALAILDDR